MTEKSEIDAESTAVVNSILLWRIYDVLILLLGEQNIDLSRNITKMHEAGEFLGPNPAYRPDESGE